MTCGCCRQDRIRILDCSLVLTCPSQQLHITLTLHNNQTCIPNKSLNVCKREMRGENIYIYIFNLAHMHSVLNLSTVCCCLLLMMVRVWESPDFLFFNQRLKVWKHHSSCPSPFLCSYPSSLFLL